MKHQPVGVILLLLLVPTLAIAYEFTPTDVGGGGWLHSAAFHPTDSGIVFIGSHVGGAYRTGDGGQHWAPWNNGLAGHNETESQFIDDLESYKRPGDAYAQIYAATRGGLYSANADFQNSTWYLRTPASAFCYRKVGEIAAPIPFTCIDFDGDNRFYAGAGWTWWDKVYTNITDMECKHYPGLPDALIDPSVGAYPQQYTVWQCNLLAGNTWTPDTGLTGAGAARDITVARIGGVNYIVVTATQGIFLKKGAAAWIEIGTDLENDLAPWSVHLTARGTLYVAFRHKAGAGVSGVYRIHDITQATTSTPFSFVGDQTLLPPLNCTMSSYGADPATHLINLAVKDGSGADPDTLLLGDRGYSGFFRGSQAFGAASPCTWTHLIYTRYPSGTVYWWDVEQGQEVEFTAEMHGWQRIWGIETIFPPVISKSDPNRVIVQFNARLHQSPDLGNSWEQVYTTTADGGESWTSTGYNELGAQGLDFTSDGRIVQGTADAGAFLSMEPAAGAPFRRICPGANRDYITNPRDSDLAWSNEAGCVRVRPNWNGTGEDAIFVTYGDLFQAGRASKLFKYQASTEEWENITGGIPDLSRFVFGNFAFSSDDTCFITYTMYSGNVGELGSTIATWGVKRGVFNGSSWEWIDLNGGLAYGSQPLSSVGYNRCPADILFHEPSGRVFLACAFWNLGDGHYGNGCLMVLDEPSDDSWRVVCGDTGTDYRDVKCLAQSSQGEVIYAGTRGRSSAGIGTLLKCSDPVNNPEQWAALANTDATGYPFGWHVPFWAKAGYGLTTPWDSLTVNRRLTDIRSLAVEPNNPNNVWVGMGCQGYMYKEGLWLYRNQVWTHKSNSEQFRGIGVYRMAIRDLGSTAHLVVGASGQGLYHKIYTLPPPQAGTSSPNLTTLRILQVKSLGNVATISFNMTSPARARFRIYDLRGRLVREMGTEMLARGDHSLSWDGRDSSGRSVASGVYHGRLRADSNQATCRIVMIH